MTHKMLSTEPLVHPEATIKDSQLGAWTEVGARTLLQESSLGDYSYVVHDSDIIYTEIGKFCSIASQVRINPGNHPLDRAALHHFTYRSRQFEFADEDDESFFDWRREFPTKLGNDVWIGHGSTVMPGVTIGTGAAVGSGAVVTKDVEPFTVVAGVPAKPIRQRFDDDICEALLRIQWWDWEHEEIKQALQDFRDLSAAGFVGKYDR